MNTRGEAVKIWHVYITSRGPAGPIGDCVETTESLARLAALSKYSRDGNTFPYIYEDDDFEVVATNPS